MTATAQRAAPPAISQSAPSSRIQRIRRRYQTEPARISVVRARLYTESWKATEGTGLQAQLRVALAGKRVLAGMPIYVDPDDRIAGTWTETFLGAPIDIERGVFNEVLAAELTRGTLVRFRAHSLLRSAAFLARNGLIGEAWRSRRTARAGGAEPLRMPMETMAERSVNKFVIDPTDRRLLLGELLPYWRGRCLVDRLEGELRSSGLLSPGMHDFVTAMAGSTSRQVLMLSTCASIATLQGHVILDFDRVLRLGLCGLREEIEARLGALPAAETDRRATLEASRTALAGVHVFAERLAAEVETAARTAPDRARRAAFREMAAVCRRVPHRPPATFREAVQALWTVKTAVEVTNPLNLHCFGRLDQMLAPFYDGDLAAGRTTPEAACELLEELLLKIQSQNLRPESGLLSSFYQRFLGSSPVTVGGVRPDGTDATNAVTYLFVRAAHRSRAVTNLTVRVAPSTPDALLHEVASRLSDGAASFSLQNDEVTIEAMRRRGFAPEDARDYAIMGCVEATCPGRTGSMSANALLLCRLLDVTLRGGASKTIAGTIPQDGLDTGDPERFRDLDDLLEAFYLQARYFLRKIVDASNLRDRLYAEHLPAPFISTFMQGCLDSGRDVTRGGARYDLAGISMINAVANLVDALVVIQRLCFDEERLSIRELLEAVDDNFCGHEDILRRVLDVSGKWGNGHPETDALARRVTSALFAEAHRHRTGRGSPFVVYLISMTTHTIDGRLSIATPDGRRAGTPFAASGNPYNVERRGLTAALRSVAALPLEEVLGCAINVRLHPTALGPSEQTRAKWVALVRAYFALGGAQLQPTVASRETLEDAQRHPERYRDLVVKVGGYSTYFTDLGHEIQAEIMARTEHR